MKYSLAIILLLCCTGALAQEPKERKWHFETDLRYQHMMFYNAHYKWDYHVYDSYQERFVSSKSKLSNHAIIGDYGFNNSYGGNSLLLMETYRLSPRWTVGLGVGLSVYNQMDENFVPIFALGRCHPWLQHSHAYLYAEAGFLGCPGLNLGYGVSVKAGKKRRISFKIGYDLQPYHYKTDTEDMMLGERTWMKSESTTLMHCLQGSVGIVF